ncbi:3-oxoacyl-[acyl-carrier-protein] reductase FabG (plasmid) [Rhodococcus ruber]|uniref:SDR family NAD(P)-dependent oxidoreductase n=1 Tax=Rhodococcus ruber TaxID=1830 RepID=UPI00315CC60C
MSGLDGRVVIVTGGSRGVGRGISRRLAAEGAIVAVNYRRDADAATEVVQEITSTGGRAAAYPAAIDDTDAVLAMVDAIRNDLGPVSGVVSNAGTASKGLSIADSAIEDFHRQLGVHALGPIALIRAVLPDLRAADRGDVVMISSNTVASAPPSGAPYTMAKAAMETAVLTLAREERDHGIHANIVAPGLVMTEMGRRLVQATSSGTIEDLDTSSPFGRVCRPEDVASTVAFLMSDSAGYITGQRLYVDGGGPAPTIY